MLLLELNDNYTPVLEGCKTEEIPVFCFSFLAYIRTYF